MYVFSGFARSAMIWNANFVFGSRLYSDTFGGSCSCVFPDSSRSTFFIEYKDEEIYR
jgi:hypothetical protein